MTLSVIGLLVPGACTLPTEAPGEDPSGTPTSLVTDPASAPATTGPSTPTLTPEVTSSAGATDAAPPGQDLAGLDVTVTLAASDAASIELAGFVASVVEDDGECVFELTGNGTAHRVVSTGLADATTTVCSASVPRADLASGPWSVVLNYSSASGAGRSAAVTLDVP